MANVGHRVGAALIDFVIIGLYLFIVSYFLEANGFFSNTLSKGKMSVMVFFYLPWVLYFPLLEFFLNGRTIGKSLLKIRVSKINGKPPSFGETLLRWLLRAFDVKIGMLFFFLATLFSEQTYGSYLNGVAAGFMLFPIPIIGMLFIITTKNNQRLGDLAANTVVILNEKRVSLEETIFRTQSENYQAVFKQVLKLSDKDIYIIKKVVEKADQKMDHQQVIPLANKAKEILEIETDMLPLVFLKTLLNDYNALARQKDLENE